MYIFFQFVKIHRFFFYLLKEFKKIAVILTENQKNITCKIKISLETLKIANKAGIC